MERKVKYTYEFKVCCVEEVLKKQHSALSVSRKNGVNESNLRNWISFYQQYGKESLIPRKNQNYSVEYKLNVLKAIKEKFLSLNEACLEFNIPSNSVILKWQRAYLNFGIEGLKTKPRGRPKNMNNFKRKKRKSDKPLTREEELLLENEALRAELDLLKKLQALVQARKKQKP